MKSPLAQAIGALAWILLALPGLSQSAGVSDSNSEPTESELIRSQRSDGGWEEREVIRSASGELVSVGSYKRFDAEGRTRVEGQFKSGKSDGVWRWRGNHRNLLAKGVFKDGMRSGRWSFYWPNGDKRASGKFHGPIKVGEWKYFHEDGSFDAARSGERQYLDGAFQRGGIGYAGHLLRGALDGAWTLTWPNGQRMMLAEYESGRSVGRWQFFHPDGSFDPDFIANDWGTGGFEMWMAFEPQPGTLVSSEELSLGASDGGPVTVVPVDFGFFREQLLRSEAESEFKVAMDRYLHGSRAEQRAAHQFLKGKGRGVLYACLAILLDADLSNRDEVESMGRLILEFMEPVARRSFGWSLGIDADGIAANRRALIRWISFYWLTANNPLFWDMDMHWGRPASPPVSPSFALKRSLAQSSDHSSVQSMQAGYSYRVGKNPGLRASGGSGTQTALKQGLLWLVNHQEEDGHWSAAGFYFHCPKASDNSAGDEEQRACTGAGNKNMDTGVTALALIALIRGGSSTEQGPHQDAVRRGLGFLLQETNQESGQIGRRKTQWHTIEQALALSALCEASLFSSSPALREAGQAATDYLCRIRDPYLAWRYDVPSKGDNDTIVTGLVTQALVSARECDISVDPSVLQGARAWLEFATEPATGRIGYDQPGSLGARYPFNENYPREKGEATTALALWAQLLLGENPDDKPGFRQSAGLLLRTLPEWDPEGFGCDLFYWTFGTYAMFALGGEKYWKKWNLAMKSAVLDSQRHDAHSAGSWDPVGPWGATGGRVYSTAMQCLTLEAYYWRKSPDTH